MSASLPPFPAPGTVEPTVLGYAGFWWRTLAVLIDAVVLQVATIVLGRLTGWRVLSPGGPDVPSAQDDVSTVADTYTYSYTDSFVPALNHLHWHGGALSLANLLLTILYFALLESSRWQGTIGKRACRLSVTDLSGARIGFGRALARYLAKFISGLLLGIGFLMVAWTHRKQGLHDKIAGTLVLRRRPADTVFAFAPPPR